MIKRLIVVCALLLCASNAVAATESVVQEFLVKAKFRESLKIDIRNARGGLPANKVEKFLSLVNFNKIENEYTQAMISGMSNAEVKALISAYEIPGYTTALRKQMLASATLLNVISSELQRAVKLMSQEK